MPFVTEPHRFSPDLEIPGDCCFLEYRHIMREWRESPRWTTIDRLAERLYPDKHERAFFLAFFVFMGLHGLDYEQDKREENGDI